MSMEIMKKTIDIDKDTRIGIIDNNYVLLDKKLNKKKNKMEWHVNGYFSNLESLAHEYMLCFPYSTKESIKDIKGLVTVIKKAEENLIKLFKQLKSKE